MFKLVSIIEKIAACIVRDACNVNVSELDAMRETAKRGDANCQIAQCGNRLIVWVFNPRGPSARYQFIISGSPNWQN